MADSGRVVEWIGPGREGVEGTHDIRHRDDVVRKQRTMRAERVDPAVKRCSIDPEAALAV